MDRLHNLKTVYDHRKQIEKSIHSRLAQEDERIVVKPLIHQYSDGSKATQHERKPRPFHTKDKWTYIADHLPDLIITLNNSVVTRNLINQMEINFHGLSTNSAMPAGLDKQIAFTKMD